jgi:hypothetical protein
MSAARALIVLWPAFLAAGVLEMLVFALVDPSELQRLGDGAALSRQAIYTLAFFVFWAAIAAAAAVSVWLAGGRHARAEQRLRQIKRR